MSIYYDGRIAASKLNPAIVDALVNNTDAPTDEPRVCKGVHYLTETFNGETYFTVLRSSTRGNYQKINKYTADLSQPRDMYDDETVRAYAVPHNWARDDQPEPVYIEAGEVMIVEDTDESGYALAVHGHFEVLRRFNVREFYLNYVPIGYPEQLGTFAPWILAELLREGYIRPVAKSVRWQVGGTMHFDDGGIIRGE